jgi:hypothetical protein
MNNSKATFVATCHPFIATETLLKRRALARPAKKRRDPGEAVLMASLVTDVLAAIASFEAPADLQLEAWFGTADRLAYVHPSAVLDMLGAASSHTAQDGSPMEFITAVGPRSYWPEVKASAYGSALAAFREGGEVEGLAQAAKALVSEARRREAAWGPDEWQFRMTAAIVGWVYWDDEPGARESAPRTAQ